MKKLLLTLGATASIALPIGVAVSCSMDEIIGTVAIIKERKGFVVIASVLSTKLTVDQSHNALKALKYVYDKQGLSSDLLSLEIGASDSDNTMAFKVKQSDMPKINEFLKGNVKDATKVVLDILQALEGKLMPKDPNAIK